MIYHNLHECKCEKPCVVLGMFDGVHIGHRSLIEMASATNSPVVVFTFFNHPSQVLEGVSMKLLMTPDEKAAALEAAGAHAVIMSEFTREFASLSPSGFIDMLTREIDPRCVVAGFNYRFGKNGEGTADTLTHLLGERGRSAIIAGPVMYDGKPVSSSRIRSALLEGDAECAAGMLGADYSISGTVVHGKAIGRSMGIPTANLMLPAEKLLPKNGVYACVAHIGRTPYAAVCNIGPKPTVGDRSPGIEVHIIGYSDHLYGDRLTIKLRRRLRDITDFGLKDKLRQQILLDCAEAQKLAGV